MPDAGKRRHRSALHGRILNHHPCTMGNAPLLKHFPGKARVLSAVGGAILHHDVLARNGPELMGDVGQDMRFGAIPYRDGAVARVV